MQSVARRLLKAVKVRSVPFRPASRGSPDSLDSSLASPATASLPMVALIRLESSARDMEEDGSLVEEDGGLVDAH